MEANFKIKISVFVTLVVLFLSYTGILYFREYKDTVPADTLAQEGKMVWQQKNCVSCHQLYGLGGHLGPDLTNVYSKKGDAYIKSFLQSGTVVMPDFHLSNQEMSALIAFLKYTDGTGVSDPNSFTKHIYGTVSQQ